MDKRETREGKRQGTFSFLGFTFYLGRNQRGTVISKLKTDRKRFSKKLREIKEWAKSERHNARMRELWQILQAKLRGHVQYYGVSHNSQSLSKFIDEATRIFYKWMNRRSQKRSFTWDKFELFMKRYPRVRPVIRHRLF